MPPIRLLASVLLRRPIAKVVSSFLRPASLETSWQATSQFQRKSRALIQTVRWQSQASGSESSSKQYSFADIQSLIASPVPSRILIDTREPSELKETGHIPTAINIPVTSAPDAFFLTDEEFEDRFRFSRPPKDVEVIFYCKAGVRSRAAAALARQAGWKEIGEYSGSWLDWAGNGGKVER